MAITLIHNALIVNEGIGVTGSVLIEGEIISEIFLKDVPESILQSANVIDAEGLYLIPGVIDDQVHFREPGLTYKADIYSESKAAVAGGVTSFMEMPNTNPQTTTQKLLTEKFKLGADKSLANYSFYIGATNDNIDELLLTDTINVCGIKIFMGASTGNMLVDNPDTLEQIFKKSKILIATHCEDESIIRENTKKFTEQYGEDIPVKFHGTIRSEEACFKSSSMAVNLAKKYDSRLHILHLSTAKELGLFQNNIPLKDKRITNEVCVHHLWFEEKDYETLGTRIKWNPAIKTHRDKEGLFKGLLDNIIDVIATDHAPHTVEEKANLYSKAPSGGPLVQHSLNAMLEFHRDDKISLGHIVYKMCHSPAIAFNINKRGFIRKGYFADLVLLDTQAEWKVSKENILYKCGWSPFEGVTMHSKVISTYINGHRVFHKGEFDEQKRGQALQFER
jgi:dihydroorotase